MRRTMQFLVVMASLGFSTELSAQSAPPPPPPRAPVTKPSDVYFTGGTRAQRDSLNSRDPDYIIARDFTIAGWIVRTFWNAEDWKYGLLPDPDFIATHGGGTNSPLASATLPGHIEDVPWYDMGVKLSTADEKIASSQRLPFADLTTSGQSRGVTINSFLLTQHDYMEVELNKWYVKDATEGSYHFKGRGPAPAGWVQSTRDPNVFWPYDPERPDGNSLGIGDYVVVRGTLWQDGGHVDGWLCSNLRICEGAKEQNACWNRGEIPPDPPTWPKSRVMRPNGGWIEIHPVDGIWRAEPVNAQPKTARKVALCAPVQPLDVSVSQDFKLTPLSIDEPGDTALKNAKIHAFVKPAGYHLEFQELVDGRFTDMRTVDEHWARVVNDTLVVHVKVHSSGSASLQGKEGRFKAGYILYWAPPAGPPRMLATSMTPALVTAIGSSVGVTVHVEDATTHAKVSGTVLLNGVPRGATNTPLSLTVCKRTAGPRGTLREIEPQRVTVTAPGYPETSVAFDCKGAE